MHEFVALRINVSDERQQVLLENAGKHWSVHYTVENAHSCRPTPADPSPDVDLDGVFRPRFVPRLLAPLAAVKAPVRLHLYTCFVCPDDVPERTTHISLGPLQAFGTVGCADELTVSCSTPSPSQ